jgi:hypothetical protein
MTIANEQASKIMYGDGSKATCRLLSYYKIQFYVY